MLQRLFGRKERWRCAIGKESPSKKVLKAQREALRSRNAELKVHVLRHVAELADHGQQDVLGAAHLVEEVCHCLCNDVPEVQEAAADALSALCHHHAANAAAAITTGMLIPRALAAFQLAEQQPRLARATAALLAELVAASPADLLPPLLQPGGLSMLLRSVDAISRAASAPGTGARKAEELGEVLQALASLLWSVAAAGGTPVCREVGKSLGLATLLGLTQLHRTNPAIVRSALGTLALITAQVPGHRLPLAETGGIKALLSAIKDTQLPWSVRQYACQALQQVCASPTACADFVGAARGLEVVMALVEAYVVGKLQAGPQTPAAASSRRGRDGDTDVDEEDEEPEPDASSVAEDLLLLVAAVARDPAQCDAVADAARVRLLMAAFRKAMADFKAGHYRVAVACALVLFSLSGQSRLLPAVSGHDVTAPLGALLERGLDYASCASVKAAQVVTGAWCAAGLLAAVLACERAAGKPVAKSPWLAAAVRLLDATAPALVAVMAPGAVAAAGVRGRRRSSQLGAVAGLSYLEADSVQAALRGAVAGLLDLGCSLAADVENRPDLAHMGLADAVQQVVAWRAVQWPAKRLLHLLGHMEVEYQPLVRYGPGLLAQLLASQGIEPGPFLARSVDAHILLSLEEAYLRQGLGLDEVQARKVARVQAAHALFNAMDAVDGRINGCVSAQDLAHYLEAQANLRPPAALDLAQRVFQELQVLPGEPLSFMQFVAVYPWLASELDAFMPGPGPEGGSAAVPTAGPGGFGRPSKRARVAGGGGVVLLE